MVFVKVPIRNHGGKGTKSGYSYTRKKGREHSKRKAIIKTIAGPRFYDKKTGEYYGTPDRETIQRKFKRVK